MKTWRAGSRSCSRPLTRISEPSVIRVGAVFALSRRAVFCTGLVFTLIALGAPSPPARWMDLDDSTRAQLMGAGSGRALAKRLIENSARFLGTPYLHSPLGEGKGKDSDPLIRFDAVDCQTFVEETISLSLAHRADEVEPLLVLLRYSKEATFNERNHLMEAEWIPNNVNKGFLKDITRQLGGPVTVVIRKTLNKATWASKSSRELGLSPDHQPIGTFELQMIPLDKVMALANRIPSGAVLLVVREDRPYKATRISHLGFVVHSRSRTYLRHATTSASKVVDEELRSFLLRNSKYEKWKVVGVSLFQVVDKSPLAPGEGKGEGS